MQTLEEMAKVAMWHNFEAADYNATGNTACANHHTAAAAAIRAAMVLLSDAGNIIGDTAVFCSNAGGWFENDPTPIASELGNRCNDFSAALKKGLGHD